LGVTQKLSPLFPPHTHTHTHTHAHTLTAHSAPVTSAIFAPVPGITVDEGLKEVGQMIVAADYQGGIKIYVNSEQL